MGVIKPKEQKCINRRSRRKCANYEQLEAEYQQNQEHWDKYQDKESWNKMWTAIQLAVFNAVNKRLEHILPKEEIEERATDITCNIIRSLLKKKKNGKPWKIGKLSSAVYLPCLALYAPDLKNYDELLDESYYTHQTNQKTNSIREYDDTYIENGIYHLHREYGTDTSPEKDKNNGMNFLQAFSYMTEKYDFEESEIKAVIGLVEDYGAFFINYCNQRQIEIIEILVRLLEGDAE